MKKFASILCAIALMLRLCAWGNTVTSVQDGIIKGPDSSESGSNTVTPQKKKENTGAAKKNSGLTILTDDDYAHGN